MDDLFSLQIENMLLRQRLNAYRLRAAQIVTFAAENKSHEAVEQTGLLIVQLVQEEGY